MKKIRSYVLVGVCGILAVSSVLMTIETATSGMEIAKLEETESILVAQKSELEAKLVKSLSLGELAEQSEGLGFVKASDLVYLTLDEPVAKLP